MLSLAEYVASSQEILSIGRKYEAVIGDNIDGLDKELAIGVAMNAARAYQEEYHALLRATLFEVARNAVNYYADELDLEIDREQTAENIVERQYATKYFGATLADRLAVNGRRLVRRIVQTAAVDPQLLDTIFTQSVPFGAQASLDKRVLLGTAAKIENDAARGLATYAGVHLVRWTLSHRHVGTCMCDEYANAINADVVAFMYNNDLHEDPKGLYLVENLPHPPHPNCQCEYAMVIGGTTQRITPIKRTVEKIKRILSRLRRK